MNYLRYLPISIRFIVGVLICSVTSSPLLSGEQIWKFGSDQNHEIGSGWNITNSSPTIGTWTAHPFFLRFEAAYKAKPDETNTTEAFAMVNMASLGYQPGNDFTLWLLFELQNVWEWNRFGLVAFAHPGKKTPHEANGALSARLQTVRRGAVEMTLARDFEGRSGEKVTQALPEKLTNDRYRLILIGEHQPDESLRLTFSVQRGDDDTPYRLTETLEKLPSGTYFGFGGRFRSYEKRQPVIDLIEMRFDPKHAAVSSVLSDPVRITGVWHDDGKVHRYRASLRLASLKNAPLDTTILTTEGLTDVAHDEKIQSLLESGRLVVELNTTGWTEDNSKRKQKLHSFLQELPSLLEQRSKGLLRTRTDLIECPSLLEATANVEKNIHKVEEGMVIRRQMDLPTPSVLAYNLGHFFEGSNAHDWWAYSGATGARTFINPAHSESTENPPPGDAKVKTKSDFLNLRERLTSNPKDKELVNWNHFLERKSVVPLEGTNRIHVDYALGHLAHLSPDVLIQANMVPEVFPISGENDWAGKWRLWRSFFSMTYYYASTYGIHRFAMHNEPNHPLMLIDPAQWLMRAALSADAAKQAIEAVNRDHQTSLEPWLFMPVTAGDIGDPFTGPYQLYGRPILERWDLDFLGHRTGQPLYANYAIQRYNATPEDFGIGLLELKNKVAEDLPWELPMPSFSITEFNVHHGRYFDTIQESMDTPEKFVHFASILTHLMRAGLEEFYVFKFGLTEAMPGRQFLVHKNGMFYCDNERAPHNYGGPTRAAEVYRMFIQAFAPGRRLLAIESCNDSPLDVTAAHDPSGGGLWVFSVNPDTQPQSLDLNLQKWADDLSGDAIITEVSFQKGGEIVARETLAPNRRLQKQQPAESVWLLRFPPKRTDLEWKTVPATASVSIFDKESSKSSGDEGDMLRVVNPPEDNEPRAVALYSFALPEFDSDQLQAAVVNLNAQPKGTASEPVQAQIFLLTSAEWNPASLSWSNTPGILPNVGRGVFIRNRIVDQASGAASVVGQMNLSGATWQTVELDLTEALRGHGGKRVSLLIAQEPRWDVHPSQKKAEGDSQPYGILLTPAESPFPLTPRLELLLDRAFEDSI